MMNYWWPGNHPNTWIVMVIGMVIFIAPLVILIVILLRPKHTSHYRDNPRDSQDQALRILDERFAKGEIDEEEYQKRKDILKKP